MFIDVLKVPEVLEGRFPIVGKNAMEQGMSESFPETADIETSSEGYASRFSGPVGAWMLSVQSRITLNLLAAAGARTVLDVGGGHAQLAKPLLDAGYQVTVLGSASSCRKRIEPMLSSGRMEFVVGNVIALPFQDRSFDAVISFRLLPHCESWEKLIAEMCRVAGRVMVADYPTTQSLNAVAPLFFGAKKRMEGNTRTWRAFSHQEIKAAVEGQEYRVTARQGQFFWPMVIHRMMKAPWVSRMLEGAAGAAGVRSRWGSPVIFSAKRAASTAVA